MLHSQLIQLLKGAHKNHTKTDIQNETMTDKYCRHKRQWDQTRMSGQDKVTDSQETRHEDKTRTGQMIQQVL